jgi:hypothetical protein
MPWVRFTSSFDFKPKPTVTLAYHAGDVKLVTTACATAALRAGKAEKAAKPKGRPVFDVALRQGEEIADGAEQPQG